MGKTQKPVLWLTYLRGVLLSLAIYLLGQLLLTLLLVRGTVSESSGFPTLAALCMLASLAGSVSCTRQAPWGALPNALLCAVLFALCLIAVGFSFWSGVSWLGRGGILLLCVLAGGLLAGVLGSRKGGKRSKRKRLV